MAKPPYNSLCNSPKSHQITISYQTSQHNYHRAGGLEFSSERQTPCILQAFGHADADVLTGYEGPCVQTHPPVAANLPCLTGSSARSGVLNSFVLPVHIWVPLLLSLRVIALWNHSRGSPALFCCAVFVHSREPAPLLGGRQTGHSKYVLMGRPQPPGLPTAFRLRPLISAL